MAFKKITILFLTVLLTYSNIHAQKKLSFGLIYRPVSYLRVSKIYQMSYNTIQPVKGTWYSYLTLDTYNEHSPGAIATYSLSDKFDINLGFNYLRSYTSVNFYGTNIGSGWMGNVFRTFEVPLSFSYKKSISKSDNIQVVTSLGGTLDISNGEFLEFSQNKSFNVGLAGMDYYGSYFALSRKCQVLPALTAELGLINDFFKYGKLHFGILLHYKFTDELELIQYSYEEFLGENKESDLDENINTSYLSIYIKYYLPWGLIKSKE